MRLSMLYGWTRTIRSTPDDLIERGWKLSEAEAELLHRVGGTWHKAVYIRPVDDGLDIASLGSAAYDKVTRQPIVRVSTLKDRSESWRDARRDAIRRMQEADAKRRRKRWS